MGLPKSSDEYLAMMLSPLKTWKIKQTIKLRTKFELQDEHVSVYRFEVGTDELTTGAVQVVITVLACWLASGIVFGFAALKPVLISEGVYRELCTEDELQHGVELCIGQDIR